MTVRGPIKAHELDVTLIHEHILVDFSGYDRYDAGRWNDDKVIEKVLPLLLELKAAGCKSFVDCTPNFLGRDAGLLARLSIQCGMHIITNTGYYGGSDNKYLPPQAFSEDASTLAKRWISEATDGLDGMDIYPGFIKISVNPESLSAVSRKLIEAAALTHRATGLTIASHTGPAIPAFEQIEVLEANGVSPSAFIWVHAQAATSAEHVRAATRGCWVSLDGLNDDNVSAYATWLSAMKNAGMLHKTLVSHDAGWYDPAKPNGGNIRGFTTLFNSLIPRLRQAHFNDSDIQQLIVRNPAEAFRIRFRTL